MALPFPSNHISTNHNNPSQSPHIMKQAKSFYRALFTFAALFMTSFSGFSASSSDSTFSIVNLPETRYRYFAYYKINPDGKTVTVTKFTGQIGQMGGYSVQELSISGETVTNPETGWRYTVTQVGDGMTAIANFGNMMYLKPGKINIFPGIERINDYAFDNNNTGELNVKKGCKVAYFAAMFWWTRICDFVSKETASLTEVAARSTLSK